MSLNIIKNNTSSPFHLQRSIVPQGDEDGAYARGGFNPDALYNNDAANAAVESLGKVVGAALSNADLSKKKKPEEEKKPLPPYTPPPKTEVLADDKKFDIKNQTTSNYSDYSEQSMAPEKLRKQEAKDRERASFETARDKYESGMAKFKKEQKVKNMFSNFSF